MKFSSYSLPYDSHAEFISLCPDQEYVVRRAENKLLYAPSLVKWKYNNVLLVNYFVNKKKDKYVTKN